jgi:hypothetical protein
MKHLIAILMLCLACSAVAQNQVKSSGVAYSSGLPSWVPAEKSASEINIDTTNGFIYQWQRFPGASNSGEWIRLGQGIDTLTANAVPAYKPFRNQSHFLVNGGNSLYRYSGVGTVWNCLNCGLASTVTTDQTIDGDGSFADPLSIAQQGAVDGEILMYTGATWEPSWGTPYTYVIANSTISTGVNTVLIGTLSANITLGLPSCNAANDKKQFEFKKNGSDLFGVTIDPSGSEQFADGTNTKTIYNKLNFNCACRFSGGIGVWFFTSL